MLQATVILRDNSKPENEQYREVYMGLGQAITKIETSFGGDNSLLSDSGELIEWNHDNVMEALLSQDNESRGVKVWGTPIQMDVRLVIK